MTTKRRLITDSFKVVKKARRGEKKEKKPPPSPPQKETEPGPLSVREMELQELRQFDLDLRFGPCIGISRMQRWERASLHGLNPPEEIKELMLTRDTDPDYTHCLWSGYPL
ncbi:DNA polymerase delta subunit 4 [Osmerus eperlanus]